MSTPARLAAFAVAVLVAFGGAFAAGRAVGDDGGAGGGRPVPPAAPHEGHGS